MDNGTTGAVPPDVATLLETLRAEVRARRLASGRDAASPVERDLQRSLDEVEIARVVSAHWPLTARTLPGRLLAFVNKVVRRYLRWYINPIVEQQNAYNDAVARTLRLLAEAYDELADEVARVRAAPPEPVDEAPGGQPERGAPVGSGGAAADVDGSDYAALMAQVRARAAAEPPARFVTLDLDTLRRDVELRRSVSAHWPLVGHTLAERALALHNRVVRQYLRWYINPIVEQQNAANDAIAAALRDLARLDAERRAEVAALRAARRGRVGR